MASAGPAVEFLRHPVESLKTTITINTYIQQAANEQ